LSIMGGGVSGKKLTSGGGGQSAAGAAPPAQHIPARHCTPAPDVEPSAQ